MPTTGEICERSATYMFGGHLDGSWDCHLLSEQKELTLSKGDRFPPVRSCNKSAYWIFVGDARPCDK